MSPKTRSRTPVDFNRLLFELDEAYLRSGWVGESLRGTIRRVPPDMAGWRPPRLKHSIAELVLHCAYWKNRVRHRLLKDRRRSFPLKGRDWFDIKPDLDEKRWSEFKRIIDEEHEKLHATVEAIGFENLADETAQKALRQVHGITMHDMYHTGQIRLIRAEYQRLPSKPRSN